MAGTRRPGPFGRIFAPDAAWLASAEPEEILDPELAVVDPHHHLWHTADHRYLLEELLADTGSGHRVEATVFMECESMYRATGPAELRAVGEVEFAAGMAAMAESGRYGPTRVAAAIVGFVDLTLGERVDPVLDALEHAAGGRFRGVRQGAGWDADPVIGNNHAAHGPGLYRRADFRSGLARLTARGHAFDALTFHPQLDDLVSLARECPDARLVVNHAGMPLGYGPYTGRRDEVHAQWSTGMQALAQCPNVTMKLGGLMMRLAAFDYHTAPRPPTSAQLAELWRPYLEPCIEWFGAERCMFESNFPVDKMGIGYAAVWNAFKRIAAGASASEKQALLAGTARRAYRIG
ncbi:MAG: amidohydrolase [Chromatiales bacterium]|nr:amidohydrolase [Chromatiales bacterium]